MTDLAALLQPRGAQNRLIRPEPGCENPSRVRGSGDLPRPDAHQPEGDKQ
jgi:hypothetical protein